MSVVLSGNLWAEEKAPGALTREDDPIVLSGSSLSKLYGVALNRLACFRGKAGALEVIPCQIDERTEDGDYVLPLGPENNAEDGDGVLGLNDELVFMARDTGEQIANPIWPDGFLKALEIEVIDPQDNTRAYVYVAQFDRMPPQSTIDYVVYSPEIEEVEGVGYVLGFSKLSPIVFDKLILKKSFGGSGEDPVDRMKIRLEAKVWSAIPIVKTEDDYTSELVGYIDGSVRVLRRTRNRVVIFWRVPSPSALQDNYFYGTFFEFPIAVTLPFDLDTFLSEASLRISVDLSGTPQRKFYNSKNLTPTLLDGSPSEAEGLLDLEPADWSVIYGDSDIEKAGMVSRLSISANTPLFPHQFYQDDATALDSPETDPGQVGNIGYEVKNLKGLTKGSHLLTSVLYCFPRYYPGVEKRYLAIDDAPLQVRVSRQIPDNNGL